MKRCWSSITQMRDGLGTSIASTPSATPTTSSISWSSSSIACRPRPKRRFASLPASAPVRSSLCLRTVCETSQEDLHDSLWEAVRAGLVLRSEDSYAFQHDRIQEAAYSLIPEDARAEAHLRIGRLLLAHTPPDKREEIIFEIVSQFNRSIGVDHLARRTRATGAAQFDCGQARQERSRLFIGADAILPAAARCWRRIVGRGNTRSPSSSSFTAPNASS